MLYFGVYHMQLQFEFNSQLKKNNGMFEFSSYSLIKFLRVTFDWKFFKINNYSTSISNYTSRLNFSQILDI